jgi:hypothetical protein
VINIVASGTPGGMAAEDTGLPIIPLAVLVHEARHIEAGPHTCSSSDNTIAELGASGVQYYLMLWLGEHSTDILSQADREYCLSNAASLKLGFCQECY